MIVTTTYTELAQKLCYGNSLFHAVESAHSKDECESWQRGIYEFAKWLDTHEFEVIQSQTEKE
jgi:ATP phosphoribosyltransferase regulatory subunit HisZ